MTHYWALVTFLGVLAVMAAAEELDRHLRDRYTELDEAADLCRGTQPDNTPEMRKTPPVAADEVQIRKTASQQ